jgi:hypothetical protein
MQINTNPTNIFHMKSIRFIIIIHFFSLLFHGQLFYTNNNLHIDFSKFVFLAIFIFFLLLIFKKKIKLYLSHIDLIFITLILISFLQFYFVKKIDFFIGLLVYFYIFFIYFFYKNLILNDYKPYLIKLIKITTIIASLIGIVGWLISQFNLSEYFVLDYKYPFFLFKSIRAKSLFDHPNYFFIFQILGLFFYLKSYLEKKKKKNLFLFITIFLSMIITFSKSIFLLFGVFLIFILLSFKINAIIKNLLKLFIFLILMFYLIFSHLIIVNKNSENYYYYTSNRFVVEKNLILEVNNFEIYLNNYFSLKKISLDLFLNNPIIGNGELALREYNKLFDEPSNNHHSQYMNILANKGIIGFIAYLILLFNTVKGSLRNKKNKIEFCVIFYLIFESFFSDLNSFNFLWFVIASVEANRIKDIKLKNIE